MLISGQAANAPALKRQFPRPRSRHSRGYRLPLENSMSRRQSSAVDQALALVAQGLTPYKAAKTIGIALSTIYRALKRQAIERSSARIS